MKRLGILAVPEYPTVVPYQQLYATLSFCGSYFAPERLPTGSHFPLTHCIGDHSRRVAPALDIPIPDGATVQMNGADQRLSPSFAECHKRPELLTGCATADGCARIVIIDQPFR